MPICQDNVASDDFLDFIIPNNRFSLQELQNSNMVRCIDYIDPQFSIIYVPIASGPQISALAYTTIPSLYTLMDTSSMAASGILATFSQPYLNVKGQGTIIGFIDTGIDYRNPLFQKPDGTTRILSIWDQSIPSPNAPNSAPFGIERELDLDTINYGTEYTQQQINEALASGNPLEIVPSMDENGHGTFMAGVAAGSESIEMNYTGAAPECIISAVKLKPAKQYLRDFYLIPDSAVAYQENDIMTAIKYLELLSLRERAPLVIYIGLGTNYGSHEGTSPLGTLLRRINRLFGVTSILAGGNEAGLRHHYLGHIEPAQEYEDVEIRVANNERGFVTELWAEQPELYSVGFVSPTGQVIQRVPINTRSNTLINFTLEATQITVIYGTPEYSSGSEFIFIRFMNPTPGIWRVRVFNSLYISGEYHMWLPVEGFISSETYFLNPNPYTIITEPGNAHTPITVGAYNHYSNGLYIHSSRGYSRDNIIKPELVAPGVNVYGPGLPPSTQTPIFPMVQKSGTSVAAAHVAGAAANLLTWGIVNGNDITMTTATIKTHLIRGATRNPAYTFPNREWGFGILNLYQSFSRLWE